MSPERDNLLRKIQADSTDDAVHVSTLLRSCKILAARLSYQPLQSWVESELSGYAPGADLPDYRTIHGIALRGTFLGPFGSQYTNAPIPSDIVPDSEVQRLMGTVAFRDSVSFYESLCRDAEAANISEVKQPVPDAVLRFLSNRIYENFTCMEAWQAVSTATVRALIERVRNAVLTVSLEVEKLNSSAGDAPAGSHPIPDGDLRAIYERVLSKRLR